ncbi:MAG: CBS domain-containing protein [Granulosicoccus sp.]|nr:CBS domain-containing protein [Granulosicoccus sp.]
MFDWTRIRLSAGDTMQAAIEVLDREAVKIALVVDDTDRLLGTITDGDIRRALLKRLGMDTCVMQVMNANPVSAGTDASRGAVFLQMRRRNLLHMPIVDGASRMVDMKMLQDHLFGEKFANPVLLMAGGFGKRLRPLTDNIPKPLLPMGDKPILEVILEQCVAAGFYNFVISTHYKAEMVREHFRDGSRWGVNVQYAHETTPLGTAGALGLLPENLPELPILVVNGDLVTTVDLDCLLNFHTEQGGVATVCVKEYDYQVPFGVIESDGSRVAAITEKPTFKYFVSAGMYVLEPQAIAAVRNRGYLDMPDFLAECIADQKGVSMFPIHEKWQDIGRINEYEDALKLTGT